MMLTSLRISALAAPTHTSQRVPAIRSVQPANPFLAAHRRGRTSVVANARQTQGDKIARDFDSILASLADKFENSSNKPAIVGYSAAALGAFFLVEWLIHLPGLNLILGFPLETASVLLLPYFGVKYLVDKDDFLDDCSAAVKRVTKELPGLGK